MRQIPVPLWIIIEEEKRRRDEAELERSRPTLEIPSYPGHVRDWSPYPEVQEDSEVQRGEVIIPLW